MNNSWLVRSLCILALCSLVTDGFGGPRGGGGRSGGGGRGGSVSPPSGGNLGGGNRAGNRSGSISRPSGPSGGSNARGNRPSSPGANKSPFGSRDLGSKGLKGNDKLSSILEGRSPGSRTGQAPTMNQLQSHLNLPAQGAAPTGERRGAAGAERGEERTNRGDARTERRGEGQTDQDQRQTDRQTERKGQTDTRHENVSERSQQIHDDMSNRLEDRDEPFTADWYADHPHAWQHTHPHADAWAAASWGAVTGWVAGVATTPVVYGYGETYVYVEGTAPAEDAAQAEAQEAHQLSQSTQPVADDASWLPVGVFALVQGKETKAQMLMQLSLSKSGQIAGSYYNLLSDSSQPLEGAVDLKTQKAAWTIAGNDHVVFQTDLNSLTQPEAPVLVHFGDGDTQPMTLVRMPDEE